MARGLQDKGAGYDVAALEMTKWFDTNYHYIVPALASGQAFKLDASKIVAEIEEARSVRLAVVSHDDHRFVPADQRRARRACSVACRADVRKGL